MVKINGIEEIENTIEVDHLKEGTLFVYEGELYMKLKVYINERSFNCANLISGDLWLMGEIEKSKIVDVEINIL